VAAAVIAMPHRFLIHRPHLPLGGGERENLGLAQLSPLVFAREGVMGGTVAPHPLSWNF